MPSVELLAALSDAYAWHRAFGNATFDTHSYAHYLHHKYFECNYADGAIPLDRRTARRSQHVDLAVSPV